MTPDTPLPPPDATENVQNDKEPSDTFDIMLLSPEEMLTYLEEIYTPQEQLDILTSETGVQWIHSKLAPNFPIIDASYLDECFELYPVDSPERAPCLENRQRELFAPHVRRLGEGIQNVVDFLNQLSPEFHQVGVQGAGASILPPPDPPQARIRSVE